MTIEEIQERVSRAPFHRWLGLTVTSVGEGEVQLVMRWREELVSNPDVRYTHGGVLATLVDVAADYAIASKIGRGVPTVDLRVDYHKAAAPGDLTAVGRVIKLGRSLSVAEATVTNVAGALIASGRGVYFTEIAKPPAPGVRSG